MSGNIHFKARLLRPAHPGTDTSWSFLLVPRDASARLPTRAMVAVEGRLDGHPFRAMLQPDGQRSHWLKVERALREAAGIAVGDEVTLDIAPAAEEPEPDVPDDLRAALADAPEALRTWNDITPRSRRDWVLWIESAKKAETRSRRIHGACDMLATGKRRVCCFDRSGIYSKGFAAPTAAN